VIVHDGAEPIMNRLLVAGTKVGALTLKAFHEEIALKL
jgi:hypothetical protein